MDINDPEVVKQLIILIDSRIDKREKDKKEWVKGTVAVSGNAATIQVYIEDSQTAVEIKNPRSFSLSVGQMVAVIYPNRKNDNAKYIDRLL